METLVRLDGVAEWTLKTLVKEGYFKTKNEAFRAGILSLGKNYALIGREREAELVAAKMAEMREDIRQGRSRMIPLEEVLKKRPIK